MYRQHSSRYCSRQSASYYPSLRHPSRQLIGVPEALHDSQHCVPNSGSVYRRQELRRGRFHREADMRRDGPPRRAKDHGRAFRKSHRRVGRHFQLLERSKLRVVETFPEVEKVLTSRYGGQGAE